MDEQEKLPLTEEAFAQVQQKIKEDPAFAELFAADPGAAIDSLGYFVTDETWDEMSNPIRQGITAVVDDVREQIPDGASKTITVSVSLEDSPNS